MLRKTCTALTLFLLLSISGVESLNASDDTVWLDAETDSLLLETQFATTEMGDMLVIIRTNDIHAEAVTEMETYFSHFTDFIEIIDSQQSENLYNDVYNELLLPSLIIETAEDIGEGPVTLIMRAIEDIGEGPVTLK